MFTWTTSAKRYYVSHLERKSARMKLISTTQSIYLYRILLFSSLMQESSYDYLQNKKEHDVRDVCTRELQVNCQ